MTNVIDLAGETFAQPTLPHRRLALLSRGLALLFTVLVVATLLWLAAAMLVIAVFADHVLVGASGASVSFPGLPHIVPGMVRFSSQPAITRIAGAIDMIIGMSPVVFVCWHLRGLFRLYARGIVFARENAAHLKRVGLWLVIYPIAKFIANMMFQLAGGTDKAWAQMIFLDCLILGLIVFAIAQVMEFGREIEQEKDSFI